MNKNTFLLLLLITSIFSFATADTATIESYEYLPMDSTVEIDMVIAKKMNATINMADANFFLDGRDASEMEKPDMAEATIIDAMKHGGVGADNTYFRDFFFDDQVSVSVDAVTYEKASLKAVEEFSQISDRGVKEIFWEYKARIKVMYHVVVDGEEVNATHYQTSVIVSPMPLAGGES